jgi:hypothetical protein
MREETEIIHYPDGRMLVLSRSTGAGPRPRETVHSPNPFGAPAEKPLSEWAVLRQQLGLDSIGRRKDKK